MSVSWTAADVAEAAAARLDAILTKYGEPAPRGKEKQDMSDHTTLAHPLTMSDEQVKEYTAAAEALLETRLREGTLISTYDFIAGASLALFAANRNGAVPAAWVFAAFRPEMMPQGFEMRLQTLKETMDALEVVERDAQELEEVSGDLLANAQALAARLKELKKLSDKLIGEVKVKLADAPAPDQAEGVDR